MKNGNELGRISLLLMKAKKYIQAILFIFLFIGSVYAQGPADVNTQKQDVRQAHLQKGEQKRLQKKLIKKINNVYREIIAAYKAHRFEYAQEKVVVFEALLDPHLLPEKYFEEMTAKMRSAKEWMRDYYQKIQARKRRIKEDKLFHQLKLSAEKKILYDQEEPYSSRKRPPAPKAGVTPPRLKHDAVSKANVDNSIREAKKNEGISDGISDERVRSQKGDPAGPRKNRFGKSPNKTLQLKKDYPQVSGFKRGRSREKRQVLSNTKKKKYVYKLHALYTDGLMLFRKGLYNQSLKILLEVDRAWPDYKLTRKYLKKIHDQLGDNKIAQPQESTARQVIIDKNMIIYQSLDQYTQKSKNDRRD